MIHVRVSEEDLIAEFLKKNRGVVMNILRQNLTEEQKKNLWEGEGYSKGRSEGYSEATQKHAMCMKSLGVSWDIIENVTGLSQTTIEAL